MTETTYTAKDITVLEGLEPVRLRPGMYIGSTGSRGLHHLVYEVVDNCVDEALAGRNDYVEIRLHPEPFGGTAGRDGDPGLDLVINHHHAVSGAQLPDLLEITRLGQDQADVHHHRLHDDAGDLVRPLGEELLQ